MTTRTPRIAALLLGGLLALAGAPAIAAPQAEAMQPADEASRGLYWEGHQALEKGDWKAALERFRRLEAQQREDGLDGADAAMYWQAHTLAAARREREAMEVAQRMLREFPDSRWAGEARSLAARTGATPVTAASTGTAASEEDALAAIDALLATDNPKAIPLLERVLGGGHGDKVKERALFVLIQIDADAGERALASILEGDASPKLKREAVKMLAIGGRSESLDRLESLYAQSADPKIREAVLEAWMIGDRSDLLGRVAARESDAELRHEAIQRIGAAGDGATLEQLYGQLKDPEDRAAVLHAFAIAGDDGRLIAVVRRETDPEVLDEALQALGIVGSAEARAAIVEVYRRSDDDEVRDAALQGLIIAGDGKAIAELYRAESDRDRKRELLRALTITDGDAAIEAIDAQLGGDR